MSIFRLISLKNITDYHSVLCSRYSFVTSETMKVSISSATFDKLGVPRPPKRPANPYIRFSQSLRAQIQNESPNMSPQEAIKKIAEKWQLLDADKKKSLQKEFLVDMESYLAEQKKYKETITPEQESLLQKFKQKKKHAKELSRINHKRDSLGKPKKPASSFIRFVMEKKASRDESIKYSQWLSEISKKWVSMPEQEKEKYIKEADSELQQYKSDLLVWEEKMLRLGHVDLIRDRDFLDTAQKNIHKKTL